MYVPELQGTEYGRTPIQALLQMASGVDFREDYTDTTSDVAALGRATLGQEPGGLLEARMAPNRKPRFDPYWPL